MYFVMTREEEDFKESFGGAWGYYWNLEEAINAVHRNVTDMHETIILRIQSPRKRRLA